MPEQPDFNITAFIPGDGDHVQQTVPGWCDLVLDIEREGGGVQRVHMTRRAGEVALDMVNSALHPYAGGSIRTLLWADLDALTDVIMDGIDESDMTKGKAAGVARAIAYMVNPYDVDAALESVREEAVERWESR